MRRTLLLLSTVAFGVLLISGVALAARNEIQCGDSNPCDGTNVGDKIIGTPDPNTIRAFAGNDLVLGKEGNDFLGGFEGADTLRGGPGLDNVFGQENRDTLFGGPGPDTLIGGPANDTVNGEGGTDTILEDDPVAGNTGADTMNGGLGNDDIDAVDGFADTIDCGEGAADKVRRDVTDSVVNCEQETVVPNGS